MVVALIPVVDEENGETFLLGLRRGINPKKGEVAFPGGFQEIEDVKEALIREVKQETGIDLNALAQREQERFPNLTPVVAQALVYSIPNHTQNLMFFKTMETKKSDVNFSFKDSDGETEEIVLITRETRLAFPLHEKARDCFLRNFLFMKKDITQCEI